MHECIRQCAELTDEERVEDRETHEQLVEGLLEPRPTQYGHGGPVAQQAADADDDGDVALADRRPHLRLLLHLLARRVAHQPRFASQGAVGEVEAGGVARGHVGKGREDGVGSREEEGRGQRVRVELVVEVGIEVKVEGGRGGSDGEGSHDL